MRTPDLATPDVKPTAVDPNEASPNRALMKAAHELATVLERKLD